MVEDSERKRPNRSQLQTLRAMRRLLVSRLYLRGMTIREIRLALAAENRKKPQPGQVNPRTLEPWSISTLHGDIKLAERGWERRAAGDAGERRRRLVEAIDRIEERFGRGKVVPAKVLRIQADEEESEPPKRGRIPRNHPRDGQPDDRRDR